MIELDAATLASVEQPLQLARWRWGSGAAELGRRREASRPGPMSLTTTSAGDLLVLDQVNRRVLRLDREGRRLGAVAIASEASEDLVTVGDALYVLVYERQPTPGYRLERYALPSAARAASPSATEARPTLPLGAWLRGGRSRLRLPRRIQLATGLFASGSVTAPEIWVESSHERCARVIVTGQPAEQPLARLGRPPRVGSSAEHRLAAVRLGSAEVRVLAVGRDARTRLRLRSTLALHNVNALQRDGAGRIYLGVTVARGEALHDVLAVVDAGATPRWLALPARSTDAFRPLTVAADGTVYALGSDAQGVTLWRFASTSVGGAR